MRNEMITLNGYEICDEYARQTLKKQSAEIAKERERISKLSSFSGSTTTAGDAELKQLHIGADGKDYGNAYVAVTTNINAIPRMQVSETQPANSNVNLWIKKQETKECIIPEVKDDEISKNETWSSYKINKNFDNLFDNIILIKNRVVDGINYGYRPYVTGDKKVSSKADSNCNYVKVSVKGGKRYSINKYNIIEESSFFVDKDNNSLGCILDYRYYDERGYQFVAPNDTDPNKAACFLYVALRKADTDFVVLELPIDIGVNGINATTADYPIDTFVYLTIDKLYSYTLGNTYENSIIALQRRIIELEENAIKALQNRIIALEEDANELRRLIASFH